MKMKFASAVVLGALLLPSLAMAQINTRATFQVDKQFADGNTKGEAVVSIDCNTGTILDQDKDMSHGSSVEFVVTAYTAGTMNCSVVESTTTSGYEATYEGNGIDGGCSWEGIADGYTGTCTVTNTPKPVTVTITKNWVVEGNNNDVSLDYRVALRCDKVYSAEDEQVSHRGVWVDADSDTGPGPQTFTFSLLPAYPESNCWVNETVYDSAIEVDSNCGSRQSPGLLVKAGVSDSCAITNTVFFEGIPTLSQYGMAVMALLMLGVGFVGFRRFV